MRNLAIILLFSLSFKTWAGIAVITHNSNSVALDKTQITDLFLGLRSNFPDGQTCKVVDQPEKSENRKAFYDKIVGKNPSQMKAHWARLVFTGKGYPPKILENDKDVIKFVSENVSAIGYVDEASVTKSVRVAYKSE